MIRIIYNEIGLHMLINIYRQPINLLNYAQIKVLLDEYALFYCNEIDNDLMTLQLKRNDRLFLLMGKMQRGEDDDFIEAPQLVTVNQSTSFYFCSNQPYVAYRWTLDNEQECLQIVRSFTTTSFRMTDLDEIKSDTSTDYTAELIPQHHSLIQVARSAAHESNIQLIPMDIIDFHNEKI